MAASGRPAAPPAGAQAPSTRAAAASLGVLDVQRTDTGVPEVVPPLDVEPVLDLAAPHFDPADDVSPARRFGK